MDLLQIPGKRDRKVPLLVTEDTKRGMEVLVSMRGQCGIPEENPYFFASKTKTGYLESWQSMSTVVNKTDVKNPQLITSTRLRKCNATVCQVCCFCSFILCFTEWGETLITFRKVKHNLNLFKSKGKSLKFICSLRIQECCTQNKNVVVCFCSEFCSL